MTIGQPKLAIRSRLLRILAAALGLCGGGLALLFAFDLLREDSTTFWSASLFRTWPLIPMSALLSLSLYFLATRSGLASYGCRLVMVLRRMALAFGVLAGAPFGLMLVDDELYRPIKFSYLIWRVESAQTAETELRAFRLAERWGYVWELNRHTRRDYLPPRARTLPGEWILELEWLECAPSGAPYRAYRQVLDDRNLQTFQRRRRANHQVLRTGDSRCGLPESAALARLSPVADLYR